MNRKKQTKKLSNFIKLMLYYIFFMTVHTTSGVRERRGEASLLACRVKVEK
jgi:hypothetical protein